jgi:hypothetical protein
MKIAFFQKQSRDSHGVGVVTADKL